MEKEQELNENKNDSMNENKNENINDNKGEKKNKLLIVALVICIPLFTFLGIFVGNKLINGGNGTIGDFDVVDKPHPNENDDTIARENGTITFAGFGKYKVSKKNPTIEIKNPAGNFVDMIFELKDEKTGEIIAKTDKISAGKYVYVNVMDYYKKEGNYTILVSTQTFDSKTGEQLNGMNQKIEVSI